MDIPKAFLGSIAAILAVGVAFGQEAIGSDRQAYLEFLALSGQVESPTLAYSSLSDNAWGAIEGEHPWSQYVQSDPSRSLGPLTYRLYGPELFSSYNTAYPHGMNDGSLFQGVGLNASLSAGLRAEAYGLELTLKPTVSWEENLGYDILPGAYSNKYSYFWACGIDLPQRFGDTPNFIFDWGDSEIRYSLGPLTAGFGTQAVWLGPAQIDPIILSNNAAPFPKLDIGLRKTRTPIGDIEFRSFWGYLHESDYFDDDASNNENMITGLTAAYSPSFLQGLTFGVNRTMLSKWDAKDWTGITVLLWPFMKNGAGSDQRDQRASVTIDYKMPSVGFETYLEWGRNDFSPSLDYILRYPFHTQGYTVGARKAVSSSDGSLRGELLLEVTDLESSRDYNFLWPTTFYSHGIITQGYTNKGQILGAGIGTGGNSQYLGYTEYFPKGSVAAYIQRINRDLDYLYYYDSVRYVYSTEWMENAELTFGTKAKYWVNPRLLGSLGFAYCLNLSPTYNPKLNKSTILNNFYFDLGLSANL